MRHRPWFAARLGRRRRSGQPRSPACVGSKEFVASAARRYLKLARSRTRHRALTRRSATRPTRWCATLAGCRAVPYARLDEIAGRPTWPGALCVWVNSPGNPTGEPGPTSRPARRLGPRRGTCLVVSDELLCRGSPGRPDRRPSCGPATEGVLAVALAVQAGTTSPAARIGCYAGDAELGRLPPRGAQGTRGSWRPGTGPGGPRVLAPSGTTHNVEPPARAVPGAGCPGCRQVLDACGYPVGAARRARFYLWAPTPDGDGWAARGRSSPKRAGIVVFAGRFSTAPSSAGWFRVAAVQPDDPDRAGSVARRGPLIAPASRGCHPRGVARQLASADT